MAKKSSKETDTRKINTHKAVPKADSKDAVQVFAVGAKGERGNANDAYMITWVENGVHKHNDIKFQSGPIPENGTNGVTNEALLAVVRDRLEGFQTGEFACLENQIALDHVIAAMAILKYRTIERNKRGVEGLYKK